MDKVGNRDAPAGSAPWSRYFVLEAKKIRGEMNMEVRQLLRVIGYLEEHGAWTSLGYPSLGMMLQCECDLTPEDVDAIRAAGPGQLIREVLTPAQRAADPLPLNPHGVKVDDIRDNNIMSPPIKQGTSADYLTARIARDRPDIIERMKAGEFRSVWAAARAAGLVRPTATIYTDDPAAAARVVCKHFRGADRETFLRALEAP